MTIKVNLSNVENKRESAIFSTNYFNFHLFKSSSLQYLVSRRCCHHGDYLFVYQLDVQWEPPISQCAHARVSRWTEWWIGGLGRVGYHGNGCSPWQRNPVNKQMADNGKWLWYILFEYSVCERFLIDRKLHWICLNLQSALGSTKRLLKVADYYNWWSVLKYRRPILFQYSCLF